MTEIISGDVIASADMELRSDVDALDRMDPESREVAVTGILEKSQHMLAVAQAATDSARQVSNVKAYVSTVAETTKQLNLSKDIQLDAQVMVRRAERELGNAIREGQASGSISDMGNRNNYGGPNHRQSLDKTLSSPSDFLPSGNDRAMTYAVTDNVTDSEFEDALDQARAESNVSRANVVRKIKAGKGAYESKAEPTKGNRRRADKQLAVLRNIVRNLGTLEMAANELLGAGLDPAMTEEETAEIIDGLNQFACVTRQIKKHLNK